MMPTEDPAVIATREKNVFWQNKKWAGRIMSQLLLKYLVVHNDNQEDKVFSEVFLSEYAPFFLKNSIETLQKAQNHFFPVKVKYYTLKFIDKSLKNRVLRNLLKDQIEFILFDVLIPATYLTYRDKEDWEENPVEYIRGDEDIIETNNSLKTIASYILRRICDAKFSLRGQEKAGSMILVKFMQHAGQLLTTGQDPRSGAQVGIQLREAILHIIGIIHSDIYDNKHIRDQMETLLEKFVIPEFHNQSGFIKYRAAWLFGMYGAMDFQDKKLIVAATEGLYKCILDKALPVRVQAAIALERLLEQEIALELIKPGLDKILEIYFSVIDAIDHEQIVAALTGVIRKFGDDIDPYAVDLIKKLGQSFAKGISKGGDDEPEDDSDDEAAYNALQEKELVATGCLSSIALIVECNIKPETILAALETIIPILTFTVTDSESDDLETGMSILNAVVYKLDDVPEKIWEFFLEINYMIAGKPEEVVMKNAENMTESERFLAKHKITGWAMDSLSEMIPPLRNFIKKGRNIIFTMRDPYFNMTYIELLFKSIDKSIVYCYNGSTDCEMGLLISLYITIIENYPGEIDNLIPYFLDKVIELLANARSNYMRKILVQTVSFLIY